jgi:hypothetical protein
MIGKFSFPQAGILTIKPKNYRLINNIDKNSQIPDL